MAKIFLWSNFLVSFRWGSFLCLLFVRRSQSCEWLSHTPLLDEMCRCEWHSCFVKRMPTRTKSFKRSKTTNELQKHTRTPTDTQTEKRTQTTTTKRTTTSAQSTARNKFIVEPRKNKEKNDITTTHTYRHRKAPKNKKSPKSEKKTK